MIQKNPFLKYMMKDEKKDVFHSSAYAKAQSGAAIGSASTESFNVRVNVNQNRQIVRGYRDSKIMADANKNAPKAKTWEQSEQGKTADTPVAKQGAGKAVVSNRGDTGSAVISNRGKVGDAMISNRANGIARAPQVPMKRMGVSIK